MDTPEKLVRQAKRLVTACESHLEVQSKSRETALEYYNGEMRKLPSAAGRSSVVSRDVRAVIKKIMPSITRTILSNDKVVEYEPMGPEDEEAAQQATDYVNYVVIPECDAETAIHDAIFDACLVKTGILKWTAYTRRKAIIQDYTDQPDDAILGLLDDPENEILDHVKTEETDPDVLALDPNARRHSFRLRRIVESTDIRLESVPRDSFLIAPTAESIEAAEIVGERQIATRSELVEMGYDRDQVYALAVYSRPEDSDDASRRGDDYTDEDVESSTALEEVLIYEVYQKYDSDDDGIAECHRIVFGAQGGSEEEETATQIVLGHEIVEEAPYAAVLIERDPHEFEGHSIAEDVIDVQNVKTVLLRETLDNLYAQNQPRPVVDASAIENPDSVVNAAFGAPIILAAGRSARDAIDWQSVPFFARDSYEMLGYMDEVAKDRTGITDASGGMDPEAFQNTSATAAHLMSESGIAQADAIVRCIARGGLRKAFRGLLRLVVAHADMPRTVKVSGQWVEYDPQAWNADMDCRINVGLGGGTKERDMQALQIILGLQREILASIGADNPLVKPDQLYNSLARIAETAGFPSADPFFTQPDPQEVQARMEAAKNQPDPATQKIQAQMQLEDKKMQNQIAKEKAQMEADLQVKMADIDARTQENAEKLALQREKMQQEYQLALAKLEADLAKAQTPNPAPDYFPGGLPNG